MDKEKVYLFRFTLVDKTKVYCKGVLPWLEGHLYGDSPWVRVRDTFINVRQVLTIEVEDLEEAWGGAYD